MNYTATDTYLILHVRLVLRSHAGERSCMWWETWYEQAGGGVGGR